MIPHIEYHCDTEGCNARLFDIVSEQGVIEVQTNDTSRCGRII